MNRKRNIVFVSAISIVALMLTTGWGVLSGDVWPPDPMPVYSMAGTWFHTGDLEMPGEIDMVTISPEDPRTGKGFIVQTDVNPDFTVGGQMPEVTSWTPWFGTYVRTGSNTWQSKAVCYGKKDTMPKPTVLVIMILESTLTMTAPDAIESVDTVSVYDRAVRDKDGDGLPDEGQQPGVSLPATGHLKPL